MTVRHSTHLVSSGVRLARLEEFLGQFQRQVVGLSGVLLWSCNVIVTRRAVRGTRVVTFLGLFLDRIELARGKSVIAKLSIVVIKICGKLESKFSIKAV